MATRRMPGAVAAIALSLTTITLGKNITTSAAIKKATTMLRRHGPPPLAMLEALAPRVVLVMRVEVDTVAAIVEPAHALRRQCTTCPGA
jgi:hypothetical protein